MSRRYDIPIESADHQRIGTWGPVDRPTIAGNPTERSLQMASARKGCLGVPPRPGASPSERGRNACPCLSSQCPPLTRRGERMRGSHSAERVVRCRLDFTYGAPSQPEASRLCHGYL
jgi:hypothetical protein